MDYHGKLDDVKQQQKREGIKINRRQGFFFFFWLRSILLQKKNEIEGKQRGRPTKTSETGLIQTKTILQYTTKSKQDRLRNVAGPTQILIYIPNNMLYSTFKVGELITKN